MRASISFAAISIAAGRSSGCASDGSVRYVYQDKDFGVVGMPENTNRWPTHYRRRADKLMDKQFPEGHEIVRAEEVEAGSRTLKIEGSRTAVPSTIGAAPAAWKPYILGVRVALPPATSSW